MRDDITLAEFCRRLAAHGFYSVSLCSEGGRFCARATRDHSVTVTVVRDDAADALRGLLGEAEADRLRAAYALAEEECFS